ncbi:UDP-Glycosyltransferase/glycogen phosphorylase [Sodiomyces alkalinus F11]|uniref:UDP-Glycosyltransferase/glycogen phosphorylase n=1 Tax=Sodiomyces alkalinus (strain CBS 110278 / VKM F-3762 / F11) TaxID=1314773 RepID=A0A3N2PKZ8_SODAK|nr:UDP-Glycosyltransferase/glycogen phosphorylase [Sodiomyces alkalinus F11]ROT34996.1 UDP-Glycosyltransferase/glycogen phosphorylase [Sodiomyces alkalinus F11]
MLAFACFYLVASLSRPSPNSTAASPSPGTSDPAPDYPSTSSYTAGHQHHSDRQDTRRSTESQLAASALISNGFNLPDLQAEDQAPPAYGDVYDRMHFSQAGFQAGASIADDGRVNINLNQRTSRLSELMAPALQHQIAGDKRRRPETPPPLYIPPGLGAEPGQAPPPSMNIVIQIVGSRGDVQPFIALGKVLLTYGHRVRVATHPTFQQFVEDNGLEFFSIGGDPAQLMAFMVRHPGLMPGFDAVKSGEVSERRKGIRDMLLGCWRSCIEAGNGHGAPYTPHPRDEPLEGAGITVPGDPTQRPFVADAIIANPPSFAHVHIAEKLGVPLHMMFTMPWSPTKAFPHPLANIQSTNTDAIMTNYLSYALVEMMTWQGLGDVINRFRADVLDLDPISLIWAPGLLTRLRIPYTYCWSPALIPKPNDWDSRIDIAGFYFLDLASSFRPDPDLAAFLQAGPPPVYIGFGSIVVDDPDALTRMIFEAVRLTGVRVLVSKGWGGLGAESLGLPEGVFMLGNVPHDWLFKHVSAVCHHGGAGTSAAGIRAGKPTIVVPFFGDQPFWGAMVHKAGAGPEPIPYKEFTAEKLAEAIRHCMKPETQNRAQELGARIREERGSEEGAKSFHQHLGVDGLRCVLAPSRTAVWRVRRTKVRLSAFAAAVLAEKGLIKYSDLKLYRAKEYNTEEQPWDPISAATVSLVADISAIGMAIADVPRQLFKPRAKSNVESETTSRPSSPPSDGSSKSALGAHDDALLGTPVRPASGGNSLRADSATSKTSGSIRSKLASSAPGTAMPDSASATDPTINDTIEKAMAAGDSVSRIVTTGVKSPMNFCLGLARGFRNAPRLYNDDTVRPEEKVTDLSTGLKAAGRGFALGLYDGVTGMVTQPLKGAEKEGGAGLVKGIGKGIGGLLLKPASAFWAIPAYSMKGVHASLRNMFGNSVQNYIIASRIIQGGAELKHSTAEEQLGVLLAWQRLEVDLKKWRALKNKEEKEQKEQGPRQRGEREAQGEVVDNIPWPEDQLGPPNTGWKYTKQLSFDQRKALHARKELQNRSPVTRQTLAPSLSSSSAQSREDISQVGGNAPPILAKDEEYERAIRESVAQTSRGNPEEDAKVEEAMRASIKRLRDEGGRGLPERAPVSKIDELEDLSITDEEYQELIEKAIQESLALQTSGVTNYGGSKGDFEDEKIRRIAQESTTSPPPAYDSGHDEELKRVIEASGRKQEEGPRRNEDEDFIRAIEESKMAYQGQLSKEAAARTEEDIVMEYIKRQSLAEEEFRRAVAKGKMRAGEEEDEELKRAIEESLMTGTHEDGAGGASSSK